MSDEYRIRDIDLDKLADYIRTEGDLAETPALHLLDTIRVMKDESLDAKVKLAHAIHERDCVLKELGDMREAIDNHLRWHENGCAYLDQFATAPAAGHGEDGE